MHADLAAWASTVVHASDVPDRVLLQILCTWPGGWHGCGVGQPCTESSRSWSNQLFCNCCAQVALVSRCWTTPFTLVWALSFGFCFPWLPILGLILEGLKTYSSSQACSRCHARFFGCF